jgi:hypothetical protein
LIPPFECEQNNRRHRPISRSIVETLSSSKNTKILAMPRSAPRASPKATLRRVKQRKKLETIPQRRPINARRAIDFIGTFLYESDFGLPDSRSMECLEVSHDGSYILLIIFLCK